MRTARVTLLVGLAVGCTREVNVGDTADTPAMDPPTAPSPPPAKVPPPEPAVRPAGPSRFGPAISAPTPPPPISGGTLLVLRSGRTAVAADPDRDRVYVVDLVRRTLSATIPLAPADEPGRLVEDATGRVHVVLRRGGALAAIDPVRGEIVLRRSVCASPRGLAYDGRSDLLHVVCVDGQLVSLRPEGGPPVRLLELDRDLRDVVVQDGRILVSTFRSAEIIVVADGVVRGRVALPRRLLAKADASGRGDDKTLVPTAVPSVAWRMIPARGGALVLHQRASDGEVAVTRNGYGGTRGCPLVHAAVTAVTVDGRVSETPGLIGPVLAVDIAQSLDGSRVALVAAGNARNGPAQVFVARSDTVAGPESGAEPGCIAMPSDPPPLPPPTRPDAGMPDPGPIVDEVPAPFDFRQPIGEATAVAFDLRGNVLVQTREPATLQILTQAGALIPLSTDSRADTGHAIFHSAAGAALACASCHPEGGEDGHVWKFVGVGPRRTQSLRGGIAETAPFHWGGDMKDVSHLMREVFVGRMSGPLLEDNHVLTLARWMEAIPRLPAPAVRDSTAVDRGRTVFHRADIGCAACHSGPLLTNNQTVDVGTGGLFQVPSLRGVVWRAPYMHTGCATTLADRFRGCGGDDRHGVVSRLTDRELDDLVVFLETL